MLAAERQARIVTTLQDVRTASTEDLARTLDVSVETIRRDLMHLENRGLLERVHGGATLLERRVAGNEPVFAERSRINEDVKARIGARAAELLQPGQTVVIDVGTTALAFARAIPEDWTGTVATCNLLAALELGERTNLDVLVCGGKVRAGDLAISNHLARSFFADFYPDVAFLGSGGVDARAGLTDYYLDEVDVRRAILRNARTSWILADSSKFGHVAQHRVASLNAVSGLITDAEPTPHLAQAITEHGGELLLA